MRRAVPVVLLAGSLLLAPPGGGPGPLGAAQAGGGSPRRPALRVKASWPRVGAVGVLTDPVAVRFSRPVDLASVTPETFRVLVGEEAVGGTYGYSTRPGGSVDPREVLFSPQVPFRPAVGARVLLTTGIRGEDGDPLAEPLSLPFSLAPDKNPAVFTPLGPENRARRLPRLGPPPHVTWTFPAAGLGNVYSDEVIVRFSRSMAPDSLVGGSDGEGAAFGLFAEDVPIPGAVSFTAGKAYREIRFVPERPLFPGGSYQIVVTRDARSAGGRFLRKEFRAGFGTSPFKDGVTALRPGDFTPGPLLEVGRAFHTASVLSGGGVLVAGGQDSEGVPLAATEVYRSSTGTFERVADLAAARRKHAAVTLADGRVLVCGGFGATGRTLASVEIFASFSGTWTSAAAMSAGRANHTASLLPGGRVLVVDGFTTDPGTLSYARSAEVYDPATDSWTPTDGDPLFLRGGHTASTLGDGRVLLVGGVGGGVRAAEIYDPASGTFARTAGDPLEHRMFHAAATTPDGRVLIGGGGPDVAELFDPSKGTFAAAGSCSPVRVETSDSPLYATLTPIPGDGRVVLLGGLSVGGATGGGDIVLDQVQVWSDLVGTGNYAFFPMFFSVDVPRAAHTVTPLGSGRYIVVGGFGIDGLENVRQTTLFEPSL